MNVSRRSCNQSINQSIIQYHKRQSKGEWERVRLSASEVATQHHNTYRARSELEICRHQRKWRAKQPKTIQIRYKRRYRMSYRTCGSRDHYFCMSHIPIRNTINQTHMHTTRRLLDCKQSVSECVRVIRIPLCLRL